MQVLAPLASSRLKGILDLRNAAQPRHNDALSPAGARLHQQQRMFQGGNGEWHGRL